MFLDNYESLTGSGFCGNGLGAFEEDAPESCVELASFKGPNDQVFPNLFQQPSFVVYRIIHISRGITSVCIRRPALQWTRVSSVSVRGGRGGSTNKRTRGGIKGGIRESLSEEFEGSLN
jgi:hypothetical protein